jgi:hypothetical protein
VVPILVGGRKEGGREGGRGQDRKMTFQTGNWWCKREGRGEEKERQRGSKTTHKKRRSVSFGQPNPFSVS